jgi:hypothetical protein
MDTLFFSVSNMPVMSPTDPILVSGYDLSTTYYSLIQQIDQLMRANAELMIADIKYVSHDTAYTHFTLILNTGFPFNWSVSQDQVNPDDDWYAGLQLGKCDGTNVGRDAAGRLQQIANWNIKYGFVQNAYGTHWTNMPTYHIGVVTVWYSSWGTPGTINAQSFEKLLGQPQDAAGMGFFPCLGLEKPSNFCVNDADMSLYYNELWPIIGTYHPQNPFKDVLYIKIDKNHTFCNQDPTTTTYVSHYVKYITYGIPIFTE